MFNIIPLIIILCCLAGIIFVIYKKMPLLAAFNISSIPEEKEAETKQKLIEKRLERKIKVFYNKISPIFKIVGNFLARRFRDLSDALKNLEEKYKKKAKKEILVTKKEHEILEKKTEGIQKVAETLADRGDYAASEKKYIEMISLDPKNIVAYRGLGELYVAQKNYNEAKEIFEHILKLNNLDDEACASLGMIAEKAGDLQVAKQDFLKSIGLKNAAIHYFELAEVCEKMGDFAEAKEILLKALELEPNSPKYLDSLLSIAITLKDTDLAKEVLGRLKEVNPENQKISEFEKELDNL